MEYNKDYWEDVLSSIGDASSASDRYSIEIEPGFGMPPVRDVIAFISAPHDVDLQDRNARFCILGKTIKIKFDGELVGNGMQFNDIESPWDLWPDLAKHPMALITIRELAAAFVLKNSIPPRKKGPAEAAGAATVK
jgi:hypothetical protein